MLFKLFISVKSLGKISIFVGNEFLKIQLIPLEIAAIWFDLGMQVLLLFGEVGGLLSNT